MTELVRHKFSHNEDCKQWLLKSEKKKLYEATTDKFLATGLVLLHARDIKERKVPGQNKLGKILERVRAELKQRVNSTIQLNFLSTWLMPRKSQSYLLHGQSWKGQTKDKQVGNGYRTMDVP